MKKALSILVATVLLLTMSLGVAAQSTEFTYNHEGDYVVDPSFEVWVYSELPLLADGSQSAITVSGSETLGDQQVRVYIAGATTQGYDMQFLYLVGQDGVNGNIPYAITTEDNRVIENTNYNPLFSLYPTSADRELASFSAADEKNADGVVTKWFDVMPKPTQFHDPGTYKGTLTYGIELY